MESADLDMGEIFDENDIDEDIGATGVLPDLPEPSQTQDNDEEENAEVLARLKDLSKGAAKKVVRKPQPKLDPTRLTGERGIPILPNLFKNVKFKGKGNETQDLALLMRQMEHWAHRLFPMMPFDEVIERVEKLGSKKEVQTCIKKIRLDIPILDNDFVGSDQEEDTVKRGEEPETGALGEVRAEDMWDELLREEAEVTCSQEEPESSTNLQPTSPQQEVAEAANKPATPLQKGGDTLDGITPEQLERIERNKQLALERRLKKMGQLTPASKAIHSQMSSKTPVEPSTSSSQTSSEYKQNNDIAAQDVIKAHSQNLEAELDNSSENIGSASLDSNREVNDEKSVDDSEMSEVVEKGPSQNITVAENRKENAQHWHTGPAGQTDSGIQFQTETMETENSEIADKCSNSGEKFEITENCNVENSLQTEGQSTVDSQAMSEIIEPLGDEKVILKEKPNNLTSDCMVDSSVNKSSDAKVNTDAKLGKENTVSEKVIVKGDHGKNDADVDEFDDELTEEQLMDTLEN